MALKEVQMMTGHLSELAPARVQADGADEREGRLRDAKEAFQELRKWVDTTEAQYALLHARQEAAAGRTGTALRCFSDETTSQHAAHTGRCGAKGWRLFWCRKVLRNSKTLG